MAATRNKVRNTKKYRSSFLIIIAAAFVIALNIVASIADSNFNLSADLTKEQYSVLTGSSIKIIGSLDRNIYIYYISETNQQDITTTQLLKSYSASSKKVHYTVIDPRYYSQALSVFNGISDKSVLVSDTDILSGAQPGRYTVLTPDDLYSGSAPNPKGMGISDRVVFKGEQKITSSIEYIEGGTLERAVFLTGHDEGKPCGPLLSDLSGLFYKTDFQSADSPLNPSSDTLIVVSPREDLSDSDYSNIKDFLDSGGHAMFFMNSVNVDESTGEAEYPGELKNFEALIAQYGLSVSQDVILGGDPSKTYRFPANVIPTVSPEGASKIDIDPNIRPVMEYLSPINISYTQGISETPLLETDSSCYSKPVDNGISGLNKDASDGFGPFTVGAIAQKGDSSLVLFTSSSFVVSEDDYSYQSNSRLFINTLSFLGHRMGSISIPPKTVYSFRDPSYRLINVSGVIKAFLILIIVCVFPLIPLLLGMSRRARRRKI